MYSLQTLFLSTLHEYMWSIIINFIFSTHNLSYWNLTIKLPRYLFRPLSSLTRLAYELLRRVIWYHLVPVWALKFIINHENSAPFSHIKQNSISLWKPTNTHHTLAHVITKLVFWIKRCCQCLQGLILTLILPIPVIIFFSASSHMASSNFVPVIHLSMSLKPLDYWLLWSTSSPFTPFLRQPHTL